MMRYEEHEKYNRMNYILIKNRRKILGAVCIKVAGGGVL